MEEKAGALDIGSAPLASLPSDALGTMIADADRAAATGDIARAEHLLAGVAAQATGEPDAWKKLAACRRALGRPREALTAIDSALSIVPRDPVALLMKGAILEAIREDAVEPYRAALAFMPDLAGLPRPLRAQAEHARRIVGAADADRVVQLTATVAALASSLTLTSQERRRIDAFAAAIAANNTVTVLPGLERPDFFDPQAIHGLPEVAHGYVDYLAEYAGLARRDGAAVPYVNHPAGVPLDHWAALNGSADWSAAHLLVGGEAHQGAAFCPITMARWGRLPLPAIPGRAPNLMFSILAPRTHIPRHQGVFNARLVVHIPLVIPDDCLMTVGNASRQWIPGEALVFDDTIEHEAVNDSDQVRIVLIGDAWHPGLSNNERAALASLMAANKPAASHGANG